MKLFEVLHLFSFWAGSTDWCHTTSISQKWKVEWKFMHWNTSPNSHNTGVYWKYTDWINIHHCFLPPRWLLHLGLHLTTQPQKWTQLGREILRSECDWNWQCTCIRYFHYSQLTPDEVDQSSFLHYTSWLQYSLDAEQVISYYNYAAWLMVHKFSSLQ